MRKNKQPMRNNMATFKEPDGNLDDKRELRRKQVMLGDLPTDFLRVVPVADSHQFSVDEQTALALQQEAQFNGVNNLMYGQLTITVVEAKLNKNYGLTRMDPYVRLTMGSTVCESRTSYNGAKNPTWKEVFHTHLFEPDGIKRMNIFIEVFDERSFTLDEKIAWGFFAIPENVTQQTIEADVPLSGKLGEEKEGTITLVISYQPPPRIQPLMPYPYMLALVHRPHPDDFSSLKTPPSDEPTPHKSPTCHHPDVLKSCTESLTELCEMFPNIEKEVILEVLQDNNGNKDQSINLLLSLTGAD